MSIKLQKKVRALLVSLTAPLPNNVRFRIDRWIRGRKEAKKLGLADFVIVSFPKSGRTWLRAMISDYYRSKLQLKTQALLGFDNYHKLNAAIPAIFFTHDNVINDYIEGQDGKSHYHGKKLIFLVRDPRDTAISLFYQWKYRTDPYKVKLNSSRLYALLNQENEEQALIDCVLDDEFGVAEIVAYMNQWARELESIEDYLIVRYEDMRKNTEYEFSRIMQFIEADVDVSCIKSAVEFAAFNNLKKLEQAKHLDAGSKRFGSRDMNNKNSMKVRKAKVGGFMDHVSGQDLIALNTAIKNLSSVYGYSLDVEPH